MKLIVFILIFTFALPAISNCCEPCVEQDDTSFQTGAIKDNCSSESEHTTEENEGLVSCICSCAQRVLQASSDISETLPSTFNYLFPEETLLKESQYARPVFHPPIS